jgi:hypothetical protein
MAEQIYNCKSEEVPVIGGYVLFGLKRDFNDFSQFFPKVFTPDYVPNFERKITSVNILLNPNNETVVLKETTGRLYSTMDGLIEPANRIVGYIKFTKGAIPISAKDFGLTTLKQKLRSKDAEGALKNLRTVIANIEKYHVQLTEQGLESDIVDRFKNALGVIETNNQLQFEIITKRKNIVEKNVSSVNDLYKIIIEVCNVGKTIYKGKDELKVKDYTFSELKKKVRVK